MNRFIFESKFCKKMNFLKLFNTLLDIYGQQKWWPTTPKGKSRPEYNYGPSSEQEQFEIIIGAILTQVYGSRAF